MNQIRNVAPELISASRVVLRRLEDKDAEQFHQAVTETSIGLNKWYGGAVAELNFSLDHAKSTIKDCSTEFDNRTFIQYGVFSAENGKLIGIGSFHHLDWTVPKGRIGYWVRKSEEGKGYATEIANVLTRIAFDRLLLKRLEIRTSTENKSSSTIPKKLGYTFLTVFEKNKAGNNGEIWDIEIYVRFDTSGLPTLNLTYDRRCELRQPQL